MAVINTEANGCKWANERDSKHETVSFSQSAKICKPLRTCVQSAVDHILSSSWDAFFYVVSLDVELGDRTRGQRRSNRYDSGQRKVHNECGGLQFVSFFLFHFLYDALNADKSLSHGKVTKRTRGELTARSSLFSTYFQWL